MSVFLSQFITTHYYPEPSQFDSVQLKNDVQSIVTVVSSFNFSLPHFELISQKIEPTTNPESQPLVDMEVLPTMAYEVAPTSVPILTPNIQPTKIALPTFSPNVTLKPSIPQPTKAPEPTKAPKPTKAPDVFPVDPSLKRPGETVDEMFTIAAQKACIPKAALRAIASIESGGFFDTVSPKYLLLYNSYNWWNSEFITEEKRICSGYAYDGNTGAVPSDSKYPGYKCKEGSGSGLGVMGVTQISPREFELYGKDAARALGVGKTDRRVILDALVITGLAIQKEVHAGSCSNWSASEMVKGACSYYGSCGFKDGTYYCNTFCRNLKTYGGGDCSGAIGQYKDSCWK
ncbi:MAG: hypothetical protein NTV98_05760 [Candidatus Roizmanbacteria bacterium]|nr:hypothetical protein [Candidatus Roizmanbacteria bacterium]